MSDQFSNASIPAPAFPQQLPTSGLAVASLVLSILSWVLLPIIGSILGLVFGYSARKETRAVPPVADGDGLATAGIVISWVNIGLLGCSCLIIATLMVLGPLIGSSFSTINNTLP